MSSSHAPQPSLAEIRREYGERLSDEELLLRYLIPGPDVDAMRDAGQPIEPVYPLSGPRGMSWLKDLMATSAGRAVSATRGSITVSLRR
jgi:oxaloacetate decarboxylase alpha subunit